MGIRWDNFDNKDTIKYWLDNRHLHLWDKSKINFALFNIETSAFICNFEFSDFIMDDGQFKPHIEVSFYKLSNQQLFCKIVDKIVVTSYCSQPE